MGVKAEPIAGVKKKMNPADRKIRQNVENAFAVTGATFVAPDWLNDEQKMIFNDLVEKLSLTKLLTTLDQTTFEQAAIIIERLNTVDKMLNDPKNTFNINATSIRQKYFQQYLKICGELALSPAARAKLGTLSANNKATVDPLMAALGGDEP